MVDPESIRGGPMEIGAGNPAHAASVHICEEGMGSRVHGPDQGIVELGNSEMQVIITRIKRYFLVFRILGTV